MEYCSKTITMYCRVTCKSKMYVNKSIKARWKEIKVYCVKVLKPYV